MSRDRFSGSGPGGEGPTGPGELPRIPELDDDYALVRELGRGGTAVVYLARERELGRDVAIKLMLPSHLQDEDAVARLVREARTVGRLQHPNIVMLLGTRRLGQGGLALILQYVPGPTLKDRIREEGPLPIADVERILGELGRALAYAHRHRIVHRDIKPENVYLDESAGVARLADFGIARAWDSDSGLTLPGTAIGTPSYMSPEQVDGSDLDGRSDLYSLGLVAWEMLTGRQPWAGESLYETIYRQKHEDLPEVASLRPDVPPHLEAVVRRALRKRPEERWSSAEALLRALGGGAAAGPSAERPSAHGPAASESPPAREAPVSGGPVPDHPFPEGPFPEEAIPAPPPPRGLRRRAANRRRRLRTVTAAALVLLVGAGAAVFLEGPEGQARSVLGHILPTLDNGRSGTAHEEPYGTWRPTEADPGLPGDRSGWPPSQREVDALGRTPVPAPADADEEARAAAEQEDPAEEEGAAARAATVAVVRGDGQEAPAGSTLDDPVVLRVEDEEGRALAGVPIVVGVGAGGGSVSPDRASTGDDGTVSVTWRIGGSDSDQVMNAAVQGNPQAWVRVQARALPRVPAAVREVSGSGQRAEAGRPLTERIGLRVVDEEGRPIEGSWVRFRVRSGGGSVEPDSARSDAEGWVTAQWRLGGEQGPQQVAAEVAGSGGVEARFEAEAVAARLAVSAGVAAGGTHTCLLTPDGALTCWGDNGSGQLGEPSERRRAAPGPALDAPSFARITAGLAHTCTLDREGRAYCWGANEAGQLGDGSTTSRSEPVRAASEARFVEIGAGASHTCALTDDGRVLCWGANGDGQLGDGGAGSRATPGEVAAQGPFRSLAVGWRHACALDRTGTAHCWGANTAGEVGRASLGRHPEPSRVSGGHTFRALSAGNAHTCGLTDEGGLRCWGDNAHGQLGEGTGRPQRSPTPVASDEEFVAVAAGAVHTCALAASGAAFCWGRNLYGQLGDGTTTDRGTPVPVEGGFRLERLHAFGSHTCGRTPGGDVLCWGYNAEGQLGDGSRSHRSAPLILPTPGR